MDKKLTESAFQTPQDSNSSNQQAKQEQDSLSKTADSNTLTDKDVAELLIGHYDHTYELTYKFWEQRNRIFLILLGVISTATLLTFDASQTSPLLLDLYAKFLGVTTPQRIQQLQISFLFGLLQSILLTIIFYLMVNLYHRSLSVLRCYRYLARVEDEIRQYLGLQEKCIAFTREGRYYKEYYTRLQGGVKWVYTGLVGSLLLAFLIGRILQDFQTGNNILVLVDIAIALPTYGYFLGYAFSSITLDTKKGLGRFVGHFTTFRSSVTPETLSTLQE
jgi:hypothetical protein